MVGSRLTFSHYDVVTTPEDLLHEKALRIGKLLRSLPRQRIVATEQDHGRNPIYDAPFLIHVWQLLLEKMLCLVGFSGDVPDFPQRIGWLCEEAGTESAAISGAT